LDVVSAMEHHFREAPETVVWFDLFSNDQNAAPNLPFEWWSTTFRNAIRRFGKVVMVLAPWSRPIPFQRGWCIYEIFCAISTNSTFEVCMGEGEQQHLMEMMVTKTLLFTHLLNNIDVEKAECFNPDDLAKIKSVVKTLDGGSAAVNRIVREKLRGWFVDFIKAGLTAPDLNPLQAAQRLFAAGRYCEDCEDFEKMEVIYNELLGLNAEELEVFDDAKEVNTLDTRNLRAGAAQALARAAHRRGDYELECELWYRSILPHTQHDHDTLASRLSKPPGRHLFSSFYGYAAMSHKVGGGTSGNEKDKLHHPELVHLHPTNHEQYVYLSLANAHEGAGNLEEAAACRALVQRLEKSSADFYDKM